jgi:hypothetical protein
MRVDRRVREEREALDSGGPEAEQGGASGACMLGPLRTRGLGEFVERVHSRAELGEIKMQGGDDMEFGAYCVRQRSVTGLGCFTASHVRLLREPSRLV